jgi:hypothetical protein
VIPISDVDHVNHLVVFMTGQIPFPENYGGGGKYHVIFHQYLFFLNNFFLFFSLLQLAKYRRTIMDLSWENNKFKTKCNL